MHVTIRKCWQFLGITQKNFRFLTSNCTEKKIQKFKNMNKLKQDKKLTNKGFLNTLNNTIESVAISSLIKVLIE